MTKRAICVLSVLSVIVLCGASSDDERVTFFPANPPKSDTSDRGLGDTIMSKIREAGEGAATSELPDMAQRLKRVWDTLLDYVGGGTDTYRSGMEGFSDPSAREDYEHRTREYEDRVRDRTADNLADAIGIPDDPFGLARGAREVQEGLEQGWDSLRERFGSGADDSGSRTPDYDGLSSDLAGHVSDGSSDLGYSDRFDSSSPGYADAFYDDRVEEEIQPGEFDSQLLMDIGAIEKDQCVDREYKRIMPGLKRWTRSLGRRLRQALETENKAAAERIAREACAYLHRMSGIHRKCGQPVKLPPEMLGTWNALMPGAEKACPGGVPDMVVTPR